MPLDAWFMRPPQSTTPRVIRDLTPTRLERQIEIIRRVRRRLVHQRRALNELTRAYRAELDLAEQREIIVSDLRARVVELERTLDNKRARSLGNFFHRWFK